MKESLASERGLSAAVRRNEVLRVSKCKRYGGVHSVCCCASCVPLRMSVMQKTAKKKIKKKGEKSVFET